MNLVYGDEAVVNHLEDNEVMNANSDLFQQLIYDELDVDPSIYDCQHWSLFDTIFHALGLRCRSRYNAMISEDGSDHSPEECIVTEVMEL